MSAITIAIDLRIHEAVEQKGCACAHFDVHLAFHWKGILEDAKKSTSCVRITKGISAFEVIMKFTQATHQKRELVGFYTEMFKKGRSTGNIFSNNEEVVAGDLSLSLGSDSDGEFLVMKWTIAFSFRSQHRGGKSIGEERGAFDERIHASLTIDASVVEKFLTSTPLEECMYHIQSGLR